MTVAIAFVVILIGILLISAEIFLLTGTSVPGIAGIALVIFGIWLFSEGDLLQGALIFIVVTILVAVILVIGHYTGHLGRMWRRLSLRSEQKNEEGYVAPDPGYQKYLRKRGYALTVLRPAGTAMIEGNRLDVVTAGDFIEKGEAVRVVAVEGVRIVVALEEKERYD
jgi:membrane-bound serine protease (ClpP class)